MTYEAEETAAELVISSTKGTATMAKNLGVTAVVSAAYAMIY